MKRNKLLTVLTAAVLLAGTGASVTEVATSNSSTVEAAKKSSKRSRKAKSSKKVTKKTTKKRAKKTTASSSKLSRISVKSGAALYKLTFNKAGNKVSRVSTYKRRGKRLYLKGGRFNAAWSIKYRGVTYYYIGGDMAVRARDAKVVNKVKVPTISAYIKKQEAARKAQLQNWQNKINAAAPKAYAATISNSTQYYTIADGKLSRSSSSLTQGTSLYVLAKTTLTTKDGSQSLDFYYCSYNNQTILVPTAAVTVTNGATIPDVQAFNASMTQANALAKQARAALGIK